MKRVSILGSTGSIGTQTLDVIRQHPDIFRVEALAAGRNIALLIEQIRAFQPRKVSVQDKETAEHIRHILPYGVELYEGEQGLIEIAAHTEADIVVTAVVGSIGLKSTLAAIQANKTIALANKETLVAAGHLVTEQAQAKGVQLIPVDSEHSAVFQCLQGEEHRQVRTITLTASGGSFRNYTRAELAKVTLKQALAHPNWNMGAKLTIDSATMANKGLEIIEAHWLFRLPYEQIDVLIHPESIVHSLVEYVDGSVIAQLGVPDMRVPIQYALTYPDRLTNHSPPLKLVELAQLHFRPLDIERYPMVHYAYLCGKAGGTAPTVFNAANEVAVARFISGEITFMDIERIVSRAIEKHKVIVRPELETIQEVDKETRRNAAAMFTS